MNALNRSLEGTSMQTTWIDVTVVSKQEEAAGIASFELAAANGVTLPAYTPGSHIDVEVSPGLIRQYSLCSAKEHEGRYLIGVLNDENSRGGSRALHAIEVGRALRISAPRNHFPLAEDAEHSVLFAGGIGITPILSMAERLETDGQSFELHFCARSADRAAFYSRIVASGFGNKTTFYFDDQKERADLQKILQKPQKNSHLYVCGPQGFMTAVLCAATGQGWPEDQLHKEFFVAPAHEHSEENRSFDVILSSSGERFQINASETIVEVLERHGFEIPVSCEQGICGTCLTGVLDGEIDHRDSVLSNVEKALNTVFTPCCSRAKGDLLVLDL
ncbi:PDR/VanB family oxidoreductase [Pseudomonas sp. PWP3-1b2]|uniref:PDR/VanB family oxidoreductase n=1 Tax=Pseudomonas sp. PWP3-1b2 TaxID=2804656 RepID=UPI003CF34F82